MVKLFCNRCEAEINDKYYTISFTKYDVNPKSEDCLTACTANAYTAGRDGALAQLNSQKMYCNKCKEAIDHFIESRLLEQLAEVIATADLDTILNNNVNTENTENELSSVLDKHNPCFECKYANGLGLADDVSNCSNCRRVNSEAKYDYYVSVYAPEIEGIISPCSGCVYEDEDGSTEAIGNCVCCSRVNEQARCDQYLSKNKVK